MSGHTPGPWMLGDENNHGAEVECGGTRISLDRADPYTGNYVISREELLANTHLVMAAPDLLAALNDLLHAEDGSDSRIGDRMKPYVEAAHAAILKARGVR